MSKSIFQAACGAALLVASFGVNSAVAHATLETQTAPVNSYFKAVMRIPHGCEKKPTNDVIIELPEGFYAAKPMAHHGFDMQVEKGNYAQPISLHGREYSAGVRKVIWSGGTVQDWAYDEFIVFGRIANVKAGDTLYFKTTQACGTDAKVVWDGISATGQPRPKHPAPALKIVENPNAHAHGHGSHGTEMMKKPMADSKHEMTMADDLAISHPWTRATPKGARVGGAFVTLINKGSAPDRLIGASSSASDVVEVHQMSISEGVMRMQQLPDGLVIEAGTSVELKPGSFHLMMIGLHEAINKGDMVKITLEFEKAGKREIMFPAAQIGAPTMDHSH